MTLTLHEKPHLRSASFPTTPGEWMRSFRQQHHDDNSISTLDRLSIELGVSSKTISRWESGNAQPSRRDIEKFARCLQLSGRQRSFLFRAFSSTQLDSPPPDVQLLEAHAARLLSVPLPAILLDTLYFVRAWNSYVTDLGLESPAFGLESNYLGHALRQLNFSPTPEAEEQFTNLLETMWIESSRLCGSPGYVRTLRKLSEVPGFIERWTALAAVTDDEGLPPGAPRDAMPGGMGRFRLYSSKVLMPPLYNFLQFVPLDDLAWQNLESLRCEGAPRVFVHPPLHWAME